MILNKKGMTLMELMISIILISLILVFLMQILTDLRNETTNNNYAYSNQVNRTDMIYKIENDMQHHIITKVENVTDNYPHIKIHYKEEDKKPVTELWISKEDGTYYLNYKEFDIDNNGSKNKWKMKGAEVDPCGQFIYNINTIAGYYYFKLNIYVYNDPYHEDNNKDKNNVVDDIELNFYSKLGGLDFNSEGLTKLIQNGETKTYQIGKCTS